MFHSLQDICLVIAPRARSVTTVARSAIFLVIAPVSRTVFATSKLRLEISWKHNALFWY